MKTRQLFNVDPVDPSWLPCLTAALTHMDSDYLESLYCNNDWLPGHEKIFNAFSLPLHKTQYVLFGESPYPRQQSANGYAFWDAAVEDLWSETGLSKTVNRATSLRNIIKMLLVADGLLQPTQTRQENIARLNKQNLVKTNTALFQNLLNHGFLLLNATPVLRPQQVRKDAAAWQPFIQYVLYYLFDKHPSVQLILLGNIANIIDKLITNHQGNLFDAEHPYNISFITNPAVLDFFRPLHLLRKSIRP